MKRAKMPMPSARTEELVVEELADETLVYDLKRHKAHCLNRTAALVWQQCDGRTTVAEVATALEQELEIPADEAVVWMALDRLGKARLLTEQVTLPADRAQYSRRQVLRTLGQVAGIALLLPVVQSIVAPTAAHAVSCLTVTQCRALVQPNCTGLPICGIPGKCCSPWKATECKDRNC